MSANTTVTTDGQHSLHTTRKPKCLTYRRKSLFEAKQWSFDETSALMDIWSRLDSDSYETKQMMYKYIQTKLKTFGYDRSTDQIRCKLQRLTTNQSKGIDVK